MNFIIFLYIHVIDISFVCYHNMFSTGSIRELKYFVLCSIAQQQLRECEINEDNVYSTQV